MSSAMAEAAKTALLELLVIEEEVVIDGKTAKVRLVSPMPHLKSAEEAECRIKVYNVPPSEICSLDDLKQFLNGAISRLLDLDLYYRFPPGTILPGPGQKIDPPADTPESPVRTVGNLNTFDHTCVVDVSFPLAGVALRNLQGLPCFGRPLIFKRVEFDAESDASPSKLSPVVTEVNKVSYEAPASLINNSSHAGLLWLSGINPYSNRKEVEGIILGKVKELQDRVGSSLETSYAIELDALYLPQNRITGRMNGVGILKLRTVRTNETKLEDTESSTLQSKNSEDYKESAFLVSTVRGLSRLLHNKVVHRYNWTSIPFLDYQSHSVEAFRMAARYQAINPTTEPKDRLFDITRESEEVELVDKKRSMTSKIYGDNLIEGLIVQHSKAMGVRASRILQITGIVFQEDLLSPDTVNDLARTIYAEFKKHAKIVQIVIPVPHLAEKLRDDVGVEYEDEVRISSPPGTGKIFIEVVELYGARKLQNMTNGVTFDLIRTCAVSFFPETLFMQKHLTTADAYYSTIHPTSSLAEDPLQSHVQCFVPAKKGKLARAVWGTAGIHKVPGSEEVIIPIAEELDLPGQDIAETS